jgi:release factor glutamine methyltransferase
MKQVEIWDKYLILLKNELKFLPDKPEETAESTLRALWFAAADNPKSAEASIKISLPVLNSDQLKKLKSLVSKRLNGIPLAHITERQQFMGVELLSGPAALVPRKETELLGYSALNHLIKLGKNTGRELTLIDVCTGAGNLAVSLGVLYPKMKIFAADLSTEAVELCMENVKFHNLEHRVNVRVSDVLDAFDSSDLYEKADMIICNPPYISSAKVTDMPEEISNFEPRLAFDGGSFGIKVLTKFTNDVPKYLKIGRWLGFEVGLGQGPAMQKRLNTNKHFANIETVTDSKGQIRALFAERIE